MKIGIIIGKIGGLDGVALETEKWIEVLKRMGHEIFLLSGLFERQIIDKEHQMEVPIMSFFSKENKYVQRNSFLRPKVGIIKKISKHCNLIGEIIIQWIMEKKLDLIISENASALPVHLALGVGIKKAVEETGIKTIAHDHDFLWERGDRYRSSDERVNKVIAGAFPLKGNNVKHAVISSFTKKTLKRRFNIDSVIIPNVMDFKQSFGVKTDYNANLSKHLGLEKGDIALFQVTRIIRRKGIETAINLIKKLNNKKVKLIITGELEKDVNLDYLKELKKLVRDYKLKKQVIFAGDYFDPCYSFVGKYKSRAKKTEKIYSLYDAYAHADACTYFSTYEGFGNAFVESVLSKKPIFVNNYKPVYWPEIGKHGFKTVMLHNSELTKEAIKEIENIIYNKKLSDEIAEYNFNLGKKYFSYEVLEKKLRKLIGSFEVKS
jgi:glycosyltransferase involved in cell wall biosynthesis